MSEEKSIVSGDIEKAISQLFEENLLYYGENIAIDSCAGSLTYNDLNAKANVLAHYLQRNGVGLNTLVALYLERSVEFIIAILAINKAGGAYIPLDVTAPVNRNFSILNDCKPHKIIIKDFFGCNIYDACQDENMKANFIEIDCAFKILQSNIEDNPIAKNCLEDLFYIIYTSGSTGIQKGCMISQRGVLRIAKNNGFIQIKPNDSIAHISNLAFDAATFEIWGALLNGARLCIIKKDILLSFDDFSRVIKEKKISIILITTALLNLIVKTKPCCFDSVKFLLFGGEKANPASVIKILDRKEKLGLNDLSIINLYGPTECTIIATYFYIKNKKYIDTVVPIGSPISQTEAYVLDENLMPVPDRVVGELYLGGNGLALGYLNMPKETASNFIKSPFDNNKKIFKTGDLVYRLPSLGLVFVERNDQKIKIRGFNVDISEIEACIIKYQKIDQVIVVVELCETNGNVLIAYLISDEPNDSTISKLRLFLQEHLPDYMIPARFVFVDHMPLTNNGKIDKSLLNKFNNDVTLPAYEKSSNDIEKIVFQTFSSFLPTAKINISDNFFDLGANSLMLAEICNALNMRFGSGIKLNIIDIFTNPTVKSLTDFILKKENFKKLYHREISVRSSLQKKVLARRRGKHGII